MLKIQNENEQEVMDFVNHWNIANKAQLEQTWRIPYLNWSNAFNEEDKKKWGPEFLKVAMRHIHSKYKLARQEAHELNRRFVVQQHYIVQQQHIVQQHENQNQQVMKGPFMQQHVGPYSSERGGQPYPPLHPNFSENVARGNYHGPAQYGVTINPRPPIPNGQWPIPHLEAPQTNVGPPIMDRTYRGSATFHPNRLISNVIMQGETALPIHNFEKPRRSALIDSSNWRSPDSKSPANPHVPVLNTAYNQNFAEPSGKGRKKSHHNNKRKEGRPIYSPQDVRYHDKVEDQTLSEHSNSVRGIRNPSNPLAKGKPHANGNEQTSSKKATSSTGAQQGKGKKDKPAPLKITRAQPPSHIESSAIHKEAHHPQTQPQVEIQTKQLAHRKADPPAQVATEPQGLAHESPHVYTQSSPQAPLSEPGSLKAKGQNPQRLSTGENSNKTVLDRRAMTPIEEEEPMRPDGTSLDAPAVPPELTPPATPTISKATAHSGITDTVEHERELQSVAYDTLIEPKSVNHIAPRKRSAKSTESNAFQNTEPPRPVEIDPVSELFPPNSSQTDSYANLAIEELAQEIQTSPNMHENGHDECSLLHRPKPVPNSGTQSHTAKIKPLTDVAAPIVLNELSETGNMADNRPSHDQTDLEIKAGPPSKRISSPIKNHKISTNNNASSTQTKIIELNGQEVHMKTMILERSPTRDQSTQTRPYEQSPTREHSMRTPSREQSPTNSEKSAPMEDLVNSTTTRTKSTQTEKQKQKHEQSPTRAKVTVRPRFDQSLTARLKSTQAKDQGQSPLRKKPSKMKELALPPTRATSTGTQHLQQSTSASATSTLQNVPLQLEGLEAIYTTPSTQVEQPQGLGLRVVTQAMGQKMDQSAAIQNDTPSPLITSANFPPSPVSPLSPRNTPKSNQGDSELEAWRTSFQKTWGLIEKLPSTDRDPWMVEMKNLQADIEGLESRYEDAQTKVANGTKSMKKSQRANIKKIVKQHKDKVESLSLLDGRLHGSLETKKQPEPPVIPAYPGHHKDSASLSTRNIKVPPSPTKMVREQSAWPYMRPEDDMMVRRSLERLSVQQYGATQKRSEMQEPEPAFGHAPSQMASIDNVLNLSKVHCRDMTVEFEEKMGSSPSSSTGLAASTGTPSSAGSSTPPRRAPSPPVMTYAKVAATKPSKPNATVGSTVNPYKKKDLMKSPEPSPNPGTSGWNSTVDSHWTSGSNTNEDEPIQTKANSKKKRASLKKPVSAEWRVGAEGDWRDTGGFVQSVTTRD